MDIKIKYGTELKDTITVPGKIEYATKDKYMKDNLTIELSNLVDGATASDILTGKKAFTNDGETTGAMVDNGAVTPTGLNCGDSYTIPAGYHNGSGVVTANSLASLTGVDSGKSAIVAETVLAGSQGWVNGVKISGEMPNNGSVSTSITTKAQEVTIAKGYHDGTGKVSIDTTEQGKIITDNIKSGITILGVSGKTEVVDTTEDPTDVPTATQIVSGKKSWANGTEITGTMEEWDKTFFVKKPTNLTPSAAYTGKEITNGYICPAGVTMEGDDRGTVAGTYTAKYTPTGTCCWKEDGTKVPVTVTLEITSV